jgi:hypothetical protein
VIVGLANRKDWPLVRGEDIRLLLQAVSARWPNTIVNLGAHLEDMTRWVDRFPASRAAAEVADVVVAVCEASPRGLLRYLDWLAEVADLTSGHPVAAVVNRAPRGKFRQAELVGQLWANADRSLRSVTVVPFDSAVERAAWDGVLIRRGRFLRGVERLAGEFLGVRTQGASPTRRGAER